MNRNSALEVSELVKRARMENRLAVRAMKSITADGYAAGDIQRVAMPRFVRNNLMAAARRLRNGSCICNGRES